VCVGAFEPAPLEALRAAAPEIATSASRAEALRALRRTRFWLGVERRSRYRAFQVPEQVGRFKVVTPGFVRAVHRGEKTIQVWTVNEEADMRRLLDWGVDGLITDLPDVAARVRDDWARGINS